MNYREFLNIMEGDRLKPLCILYGREKYLINHVLKKIKDKYVDPNFESLNYTYIDGKDVEFDDIVNANETLPFMAERKLVVVEDYTLFQKKKEGAVGKDLEEEILRYLATIGESSILVFIVNTESLDKRRKLIKEIGKIGQMVELNRFTEAELTKWIGHKFRRREKRIDHSQIVEFIQLTGYHDKESDIGLENLEHEIDKLCSYLGSRDRVETSDIDAVVTRSIQSNIFLLVDTLGQKQLNRSIEMLNELLNSGVPAQKILYMIIRQLRLLLVTSSCIERGYSQNSIKEKTGIRFDFIIKKLMSQSRNTSEKQVVKWLDYCLDLDRNLKQSLEDERFGIEKLFVKIAQ